MICLDYNESDNTYKVYNESLERVEFLSKKDYLRCKLVGSVDNLFAEDTYLTVVLKRPVNSRNVVGITVADRLGVVVNIGLGANDKHTFISAMNMYENVDIVNYSNNTGSRLSVYKRMKFKILSCTPYFPDAFPNRYKNDSHGFCHESYGSLYFEEENFSYECIFARGKGLDFTIKLGYKFIGIIPCNSYINFHLNDDSSIALVSIDESFGKSGLIFEKHNGVENDLLRL